LNADRIAMYVCVCNGVTDRQIRERASREPTDMLDLHEHMGVGSRCGRCWEFASSILDGVNPPCPDGCGETAA
jgi:bacterioferritin-associated ferredoxin